MGDLKCFMSSSIQSTSVSDKGKSSIVQEFNKQTSDGKHSLSPINFQFQPIRPERITKYFAFDIDSFSHKYEDICRTIDALGRYLSYEKYSVAMESVISRYQRRLENLKNVFLHVLKSSHVADNVAKINPVKAIHSYNIEKSSSGSCIKHFESIVKNENQNFRGVPEILQRLLPSLNDFITHQKNIKTYSVALIGEVGSGKSSLGNYLVGNENFKEGNGSNSCTQQYKQGDTQIGNYNLEVFDTPGFFDYEKGQKLAKAEMRKVEVFQIDAVVWVLRWSRKMPRVKEIYETFQGQLNENIKSFTIVVFTFCENPSDDKDDLAFQDVRTLMREKFNELADDVNNRMMGVRTKHWKMISSFERERTKEQLLAYVRQVVHQNGSNKLKLSRGCTLI